MTIGSVHESFRFGPVGPLKNASCSSPQRPSNAIHGSSRRAVRRVARDRHDLRLELDVRPASVVAADALLGRAAEVERIVEEVRMRAGGRVDDGPAPVHELELVVAPVGALGALVLAVAGCDRLLRQRRGRVGCVEEELDVLPVALVEVVPVVVDVEEPVLERQPPRVRGVGGDVGVDDRLGVVGDPVRPALVCAAGVERVAGEVEVVLVETGQIVRRRADLDQVECVPRPPQRDRRLVEERVDVDRLVRLARAALLELLDEPDDGCVPLRECDLVVERGRRGRRERRRGPP